MLKIWLLTLLTLIIYPGVDSKAPMYSDNCPIDCTCSKTEVRCNGVIPEHIPEKTEAISLTNIDPTKFYPGMFCNAPWAGVTALSFISIKHVYFNLTGGAFDCLGQLQTFKLTSPYLRHVAVNAFSALTNVTKLDLSGCKFLVWEDVYQVLSVQTNFPKLSRLNLSGSVLGSKFASLDQAFVDALAVRPVRKIDLSFNDFTMDFSVNDRLCSSLRTFVRQNVFILTTQRFNEMGICKSLYSLDISGPRGYTSFAKGLNCVNTSVSFDLERFYWNVHTLYFNKVITKSYRHILENCSFVMFADTMMTELHFTQNYLPLFEVRLFNGRLRSLDISSNSIESLNQNAFQGLPSLKNLDLSKNNLKNMQPLNRSFSVILKTVKLLEVINLSRNNLSNLSGDIFASATELREICLSNNSISKISFEISKLHNMRLLDLRYNQLRYLKSTLQQSLNALYGIQRKLITKTNKTLQVLLEGNPFDCKCDALGFIKWLISTPVITNAQRSDLHCQIDATRSIPFNEDALRAARGDCEQPKRTDRIPLAVVLSAALVVVVFVIILIVYRRIRKKRVIEDNIELLQLNQTRFRFPVFLSFASQDVDFVNLNILQPLQVYACYSSVCSVNGFKLSTAVGSARGVRNVA